VILLLLQVTKGFAAPETIAAVERVAAMAEKSGNNLTQLFIWVSSRGFAAYVSGNLSAAGTLADQALDLALREGSPTILGVAHTLQIQTHYFRGDLSGVEEHFTTGLAFFDDPGFRELHTAVVVNALGTASLNAWTLGLSDVARKREVQMMAAANGKSPYELALSRVYAAQLRVYMREYDQAAALAARALELSEKHQLRILSALSRCLLGEARAQLGHTPESIRLIQQGIHDLLETGSSVSTNEFTAYLAAVQEHEGAILDALATVEQALQTNPDELVYRPETFRLRGELRLKQGQTELAEADFREAISLAQKMSANAWELRATTSLARLIKRQGKTQAAHAMLNEIYNWFTEGFDTADLKDAKALLDELASRPENEHQRSRLIDGIQRLKPRRA